MLADTLQLAANCTAARILLYYDGNCPHEYLPPTVTGALQDRAVELPQPQGDLGQRLEAAVRDAAEREFLPLLMLGSDSPDLPAHVLEGTLRALTEYDVTLGPAADGGLWCIGLRHPVVGLFDDVPWSHPTTGAALEQRVRHLRLAAWTAPTWHDVDTWEDLTALAGRLRTGVTHAPSTARWLSRYAPLAHG
jgi:glycosyltransferase A (GT-A) superfamily protein (DUF2064 family)